LRWRTGAVAVRPAVAEPHQAPRENSEQQTRRCKLRERKPDVPRLAPDASPTADCFARADPGPLAIEASADPVPEIVDRRKCRQRVRSGDDLFQFVERLRANGARGEMRLQPAPPLARQLVVQVLRETVGPLV